MADVNLLLFFGLGIAAFFAGLVDAVVGGGGLIQLPALLSVFPNLQPATIFGTNKLASIVGTSSAAIQYGRRVRIPWLVALPGAISALIGSWCGATAVTYLPTTILRPVILILLILVAVYTFIKKDFGVATDRELSEKRQIIVALLIGTVIGFYDGFFGPGTGSFLIFLFVRFAAMDFLKAAVTSKIVNVATNFAAISFFVLHVELLWLVGLIMAVCNLFGAIIGSRLALKHGATFVRKMFLMIVCVLIAKIAYDVLIST